ncbi:hypothetical protein JZ751_014588 [Albula glossodonta]|uniref:Uncharacterized protein n=1 Tax=Albula glossodonta TaxID=121402 RepID=A0A8T2MZ59_9TELE|nr:hypothetical protein JZ751_014588 [Albula glossodonta]
MGAAHKGEVQNMSVIIFGGAAQGNEQEGGGGVWKLTASLPPLTPPHADPFAPIVFHSDTLINEPSHTQRLSPLSPLHGIMGDTRLSVNHSVSAEERHRHSAGSSIWAAQLSLHYRKRGDRTDLRSLASANRTQDCVTMALTPHMCGNSPQRIVVQSIAGMGAGTGGEQGSVGGVGVGLQEGQGALTVHSGTKVWTYGQAQDPAEWNASNAELTGTQHMLNRTHSLKSSTSEKLGESWSKRGKEGGKEREKEGKKWGC